MSKQQLIEKRNAVLREMAKCDLSWQPNKYRSLQVQASRLANEIGRAAA